MDYHPEFGYTGSDDPRHTGGFLHHAAEYGTMSLAQVLAPAMQSCQRVIQLEEMTGKFNIEKGKWQN